MTNPISLPVSSPDVLAVRRDYGLARHAGVLWIGVTFGNVLRLARPAGFSDRRFFGFVIDA